MRLKRKQLLHKTSYEISAQKHKDYYAFENPEEVVDYFLKNLRTKFKPKNYFVIKCGFSIENYHPALIEKDPPITDAPYWSLESYRTKYFNNYLFFSLKKDILKRVIVNGMSERSWRYCTFAYVYLKALE